MLEDKNTFEDSQLESLLPKVKFSRRGFLATAASTAGYTLAAGPVMAQTAITTPADGLDVKDIKVAVAGGDMPGYMAAPKAAGKRATVIVIPEIFGMHEYQKDICRRLAKAGYVGLAIDLLSRQGGTDQFTDATAQSAAYNRTNVVERWQDMVSTLDYLKHVDFVRFDRIGVVGFCAGGGNIWSFLPTVPELAAASIFYGTPTPPLDQITTIKTPVLANYAELDRTLSLRMPDVMTTMLTQQKTLSFRLYEGVGHAFHNDTGPAYNEAAAVDAWGQTMAWFDKFLRR